MFDNIPTAAPDPIFALMHRFNQDERSEKIDLTVGVFQDQFGNTPILDCVKAAERKLVADEETKSYLGIAGLESFNSATRDLVLGPNHPAISNGRANTVQTPGGTAALRLAAEFATEYNSDNSIWCTDPTWANHLPIFNAAGAATQKLTYLNSEKTRLDFESYLSEVANIPERSAILLHTCCHNPTGFDPDREQWEQLLGVIEQRELLAIFDFAYQGFFQSIEDDSWPIRKATELGSTVLICNSYSKNMGLYAERVGGLTVVAQSEQVCNAIISQLKAHARAIYSNPPKHGGNIASLILNDGELRKQWTNELDEMRNQLFNIRTRFVEQLAQAIPDQDFSHIANQNGMFSYSGLTGEQADELLEKHAVYILRSGRINVAGINEGNIERLCEAIGSVMSQSVSS